MIKNLKVYACSHGKMSSNSSSYFRSKWKDDSSFGWYMSKKLNLNFINKSKPGGSNFTIFNTIYKDLDQITSEDLVIVQWSYYSRVYLTNNPEFTTKIHYNDKISKIYYKNFYDELQEINKVFGYTLLLDSLIPNFYFTFSTGIEDLEKFSKKTFQVLKNKKNYLNVFEKSISETFSDYLENDGFHLTEKGQELLSEKYVDTLFPLVNIKLKKEKLYE
jgi:hypothetical protein